MDRSLPTEVAAQIKGQLLAARLDFLRVTFGPGADRSILETLGEQDRQWLSTCERERWYPFALLNRLDEAIARELAPDDPEIFERMGWASARHRTEWLGEEAPHVNAHGFLARVAEEHRRFHNFGAAEYVRSGFQAGVLRFSEYPEAYPSFCVASRGYFMGVLELLTGQPAEVVEIECQCQGGSACAFDLHWQPPVLPTKA